jgi:hypothetical protein
MKKTKTIRIKVNDAFVIEQASRELAAELQEEISVSDFITELIKYAEKAKEDYQKKAKGISKKM